MKVKFPKPVSRWFRDFSGVLLGVLAAFSLQNWSETRKEKAAVDRSFDQFKEEIRHNVAAIDSALIQNDSIVIGITGLSDYLNREMAIRVPEDQMDSVGEIFGTRVILEGGVTVEDTLVYKNYSLDFRLNIPSYKDVVWNYSQATGVLSNMDPEPAQELFELYYTLSIIQETSRNLTESLTRGRLTEYEGFQEVRMLLYTLTDLEKQYVSSAREYLDQ